MAKIITNHNNNASRKKDIFLPSAIKYEFSKRLKQACREKWKCKHTNQQEIADAFNVSQATISEWWNSRKMPSLEKLIEIALYLGVCVEWLATGRGPKKPPCDKAHALNEEQAQVLKEIFELLR